MEILFWLEGFFGALWGMSIFMIFILSIVIILLLGFIFHYNIPEEHNVYNEKLYKTQMNFLKKILRICIITISICIPVNLISNSLENPFDIYKKILIYRGINSDSADKLVENVNALLDLSKRKISEINVSEKPNCSQE